MTPYQYKSAIMAAARSPTHLFARSPNEALTLTSPASAARNWRRFSTAAIVSMLITGCTTPPAEYHDVVQHPYQLQESRVSLDLTGRGAAEVLQLATQFAHARPNGGSQFVITADAPTAHGIHAALVATGVRPADISIVASTQPVGIERRDLVASVEGCYGGPRSIVGLWTLDDGFSHDNSNSALLGCAVRRNIAAMIDDPRTLLAADPASSHDGARAATVYGNWLRGESTASKAQLPSAPTASANLVAGGQ